MSDPLLERGLRPKWQPLRRIALGLVLAWLALSIGTGWWVSQQLERAQVRGLAASAEYEAVTTARIIDRLFIEMVSVANMAASQADVIQLAGRYRVDPPGSADQEREQRAARFASDPLARKVGDFMKTLSRDLHYARIYLTNMSDHTVTASNWEEPDSIVGMIYTGRPYLVDALRNGTGSSFGIARLLRTPSYFVASRVDDHNGVPQGAVTIKFDAPDMASYLVGGHIALIVNRQGRVTTASAEPFMLRNVAALLPIGDVLPPDDDEGSGEPLDIVALSGNGHADQWLIEGESYIVRRQPLAGSQYQLLTLASLRELARSRQQYYLTTALVAMFGLLVILLASRVLGEMVRRRRDERHAAYHDALTDLPNRRAVLVELERMFALGKRSGQWIMVAFIDLDGFKAINDAYGHEIGDKFLIAVGRRLAAGLRESDMLGRWGGDEFVAIGLVAQPAHDKVDEAVAAMRNRLAPLTTGTYNFDTITFDYPGASFGVLCVNPLKSSPEAVLKEADLLMYADKQSRQVQVERALEKMLQPRFLSSRAV